jgi:2-(1,2-epoxy-1,2-dihydrophenyl)acetyl-CoA isomerase
MVYETIIWEQSAGVGKLTLNRPERLNAWIHQLGHDLTAAIAHAAADDSVRALLITGSGRAFSSGADLKAGIPPAADGRPDVRHDLRDVYNPVMRAVRDLPKPVVAAVNGPAVGVGCSLALSCDLIVAAESAYFLLAFVNIGLIPDGGATTFVPAAVGKARAFQMTMLGERVPAAQALEWGLVNWVHPDDAMLGEATALAERLAAGPTQAHAAAKRALNLELYGNLDAQLDLEAELQHALARTRDFEEGTTAFVEKRRAAFQGR